MVPRGFSDVLSSFLRSVVCVLDALPTVPALCACGWGGRRYRARPWGMLSAPPRPPRAAPVPLCHRRPSVGVSTFLCAGMSVDRHSWSVHEFFTKCRSSMSRCCRDVPHAPRGSDGCLDGLGVHLGCCHGRTDVSAAEISGIERQLAPQVMDFVDELWWITATTGAVLAL